LSERRTAAILALQPFRDFEGLPEPLRARAFDRARRKFELMDRLGTRLLLVCGSVSPDAIDDMDRVARPTSTGSATPPGPTASRSGSRRCAGAGKSTTAAKPGRRSGGRTTPRSV
jgi:sugar phosphate isomerase/epimerase